MLDPEQDFRETSEYKEGYDWAVLHSPDLVERYSSNNLSAQELRSYLWKTAGRAYPSKRGEMENELRQTLFVAGAIKQVIQTLPTNLEAAREIFEMGLELGNIYGAEKWKYVHFETLKKKDASWWRKKKGDASPNEIVSALANYWWNKIARERGIKSTSKWEILIDTLGTREMCALASLEKVVFNDEGQYKTYDVEGDDCEFQVMARPVIENGRVRSWAGEIVG